MKRLWILPVVLFLALLLGACGVKEEPENTDSVHITAEEAKNLIDTQTDCIILDVRSKEEYDEGHIENAVVIPDTAIASRAETELKDKQQLILVYCRSGRRSKKAAAELIAMGYTNIKEFGGILDWPYEIVKS